MWDTISIERIKSLRIREEVDSDHHPLIVEVEVGEKKKQSGYTLSDLYH